MHELVVKHYHKHKHFIHYSLIGFSGVALDFAVFAALFNIFQIGSLVANAISTTCGITNNFFLNRHLNFKKKDRLLWRFASFYITGLVGLGVSSLILHTFHDHFGFNANIVKAVSIVVVVILQYGLNKTISFRDFKPRSQDPHNN